MVNIAIVVPIVLFSALLLFWLILYIVHIIMVTTEYGKYAFGTWKQFMLCYNNRTWHGVGESLYCDDDNSHIGHSCIYFGDCGMILDPISFLRYGLWVYKNILVNRHATKHEWK